MPINKFLILALSSLFLLFSSTLLAQEQKPDYEIEVIIFKYNQPEGFRAEEWTSNWSMPDLSNSIELFRTPNKASPSIAALNGSNYLDGSIRSAKRPFAYKRLKADKLENEVKRIKKSSRYTVLSHLAWRQPGYGPKKTKNIRIRAGKSYDLQDLNSALPSTVYELDGTIKVVLGRYLHVYTDLLYSQPVNQIVKQRINVDSADGAPEKLIYETILSSTEQAGASLYSFNFKQHRRMRSKKLHHLDNPLIGMLVYAERYEEIAAE